MCSKVTENVMQVEIKQGDVLKEPADVLICSANVYLNQSGGVGGEILRRYGNAMQLALHRYLVDHNLKFLQQGEVVETDGGGTGFQHVLHAVAVDAWYHSSAEIIARVLEKAFRLAAELGAKKVAVVALATGFGRLSMREFANGLRESIRNAYPPIETVSVCMEKVDQAEAIRAVLHQ